MDYRGSGPGLILSSRGVLAEGVSTARYDVNFQTVTKNPSAVPIPEQAHWTTQRLTLIIDSTEESFADLWPFQDWLIRACKHERYQPLKR